jgi:hypothetical protein
LRLKFLESEKSVIKEENDNRKNKVYEDSGSRNFNNLSLFINNNNVNNSNNVTHLINNIYNNNLAQGNSVENNYINQMNEFFSIMRIKQNQIDTQNFSKLKSQIRIPSNNFNNTYTQNSNLKSSVNCDKSTYNETSKPIF